MGKANLRLNTSAIKEELLRRVWTYADIESRSGTKLYGGRTVPCVSVDLLRKLLGSQLELTTPQSAYAIAKALGWTLRQVVDERDWSLLPPEASPGKGPDDRACVEFHGPSEASQPPSQGDAEFPSEIATEPLPPGVRRDAPSTVPVIATPGASAATQPLAQGLETLPSIAAGPAPPEAEREAPSTNPVVTPIGSLEAAQQLTQGLPETASETAAEPAPSGARRDVPSGNHSKKHWKRLKARAGMVGLCVLGGALLLMGSLWWATTHEPDKHLARGARDKAPRDGMEANAAEHPQVAEAERPQVAEKEAGDSPESTGGSDDHFLNGIAYSQEEKWKEAISEFKQAIEKNPDNANYHHLLGIAYASNLHYQEALRALDEAVRLDDSLFGAYTNRGWVLRELKRYEEALESLNRVIDHLKPADVHLARAYENRGDVYKEKGETEDRYYYGLAIADYTEAIRLNPKIIGFLKKRANVYHEIGDTEKEKDDREKARFLESLAR
jgi:hypothetical protein